MPRRRPIRSLAFTLVLWPALAHGNVEHATDPDTGLSSWKLSAPPFELELVQRLPDQTRAFFLARGFPRDVTERIARACVFQTIGRNIGEPGRSPSVRIDLHEWRVHTDEGKRPLLLKELWLEQWARNGAVDRSGRIAFRWATFPTEQAFEPRGDYNWGMITFGPEPGTRFDLKVVWHEGDRLRSAWIEDLECAPDRHA